MHKILYSLLLTAFCVLSGCVASSRQPKQTVETVEKLQNNTEYSAVESEWNELYQ